MTSDEFRQFLKENDIFDTLTGPRHPTTNGLAEQYVGEFKDKLGGNKQGKTLQKILDRFSLIQMDHTHSFREVTLRITYEQRGYS